MSGPGHYREAERLTEGAVSKPPERFTTDDRLLMLAAAQVHATLALAAATVEQTLSRGPGDVSREWIEATS